MNQITQYYDFNHSTRLNNVLDLIGMENRGYFFIFSYSNAYFGYPRNLLKIDHTNEADDGWETVRRL